jgi:hypothetical protein
MSTTVTISSPTRPGLLHRIAAPTLLAAAVTLGALLANPAIAGAEVKPPGPNPGQPPPTSQPSPVQPNDPKKPPPFGVACGLQNNDGSWTFYPPGDRVSSLGGYVYECGADGTWHLVK